MSKYLKITLIFLAVSICSSGWAQKSDLTAEDIGAIKDNIGKIVNFYGETLAFLGDTTRNLLMFFFIINF